MNPTRYIGVVLALMMFYGAGVGTGAALWYGRVQKQIGQLQLKGQQASDAVLPVIGEQLVRLESDKASIKEGLNHVSNNPICDLTRGDISVLNHARTGLPDTPALADEEKRTASTITQRAEADAHADCGLRYRALAAQHDALIDWLELSAGKN